ncbi:MAG: DUF2207 domain-containing protein, partial [Candidatus Bipolaricaulota bacterium]|nr:DUF2207 domain-containing protein [Candidatus Bipolaricaulota bacterium]
MRALTLGIVAALAVGFVASATYYIQSYDTALELTAAGGLNVTETLSVVYLSPHHGIVREIPTSYRTALGTDVTIDLHVGELTMDGRPVPVASSQSGRNRVLTIGNADKTITGTHVYRIEYTANRMLLFHGDYLQLYWNVTGTGWDVPIRQASATLTLPAGVPATEVTTTTYVGPWGSSGLGQPATVDASGKLTFATGTMNPGSALTIDVAIPRNLLPISPPTFAQNLGRFLWDNQLAAVPIAALVLMIVLWARFGRDPRKGTIAPSFEPPADLGPGEAGVLVDDRMDLRDVSAMVIGLAVGGYLSIREDSPDGTSPGDKARAWVGGSTSHYTFVRGRRSPDDLSPADRALFDAIFPDAETKETPLASLENRFYKNLPTIRVRLFGELIEKKLYV